MTGNALETPLFARGARVLALLTCLAGADGPAKPQEVKHRVTGLFAPDREADLRAAVKKVPGLRLVGVDLGNGEAVFAYDPATLFPGAKPGQYAENLDRLLKSASSSTFGVKPLVTSPAGTLTRVEVRVLGLDCKGCSLGAYEAISGIDGVAQATVNFKDGRVAALIDPAKTDRAALEAALKQKGVAPGTP